MKPIVFFLFSLVFLRTVSGQIVFSDETEEFGIEYKGRSFGSSWGDINGDGWYEIFMSSHYHISEPYFTNDIPKIFLNSLGESLDQDQYFFDTNEISDLHGVVFFDFDNDSDQDILVATGGGFHNLFYINDGQFNFFDTSVENNISLAGGRGRQMTCFDFNNDGLTDILFNNEEPAEGQLESQIRTKNFGMGYNLAQQFGWDEPSSESTQLSDLNSDGFIDLLTINKTSLKILSRAGEGDFEQVFNMPISNGRDVECADFNNDLLPDIYVARGTTGATSIEMFNENTIHSTHKFSNGGGVSGFQFQTTGAISIKLYPLTDFLYTVHLGLGFISEPFNMNDLDPIILNADAQVAQGWQEPDNSLEGVHVYIGEISNNNWRVEVVSNNFGGRLSLDIVGNNPINNLVSEGVQQQNNIDDILLINLGDFVFEESTQAIFEDQDNVNSLTSGDYDNDGDIDIYVVSTLASINKPNYVLENNGDGTFEKEVGGWNAGGLVPGIGESVTTGDINNDGLLDLFVTNGRSRHFLDSAKHVLFVNQTDNNNNWITMKLSGTVSNKDGLGARVFLTSSAGTQYKDARGGITGVCQDDPRLHFGIGSDEIIQSIQIQWPSGLVDQYENVQPNQFYEYIEGESPLNVSTEESISSSIFPNPSTDGTFSVAVSEPDQYSVRILDVSGQAVSTSTFYGTVYHADDLNLAHGIYLVELSNSNATELQTFVLVNR